MYDGLVWGKEAHNCFERRVRGVAKSASQEAGVILLEIRTPMKPCPTHRNEVDILSHNGRELMPVVFCPCFTKGARQSTKGIFIALRLRASERCTA
jgi:hypothetical protein